MQKKNIKTPRLSSGQAKAQIKPFGDRVLVRPFTEEELRLRPATTRQAQGKKPTFDIILPESVTKAKSAQGKVLAVGEGKWVEGKLVPVRLKVGDIVVFSKYGYDEVEQEGEELYLLKEDSILAVIK